VALKAEDVAERPPAGGDLVSVLVGPGANLARKVQNVGDGYLAGRTEVSTVSIIVAIWVVLVLGALVVGVARRDRVLHWITGLDHEVRNRWDLGDDDVWDAFLADHPELSRDSPVPKP